MRNPFYNPLIIFVMICATLIPALEVNYAQAKIADMLRNRADEKFVNWLTENARSHVRGIEGDLFDDVDRDSSEIQCDYSEPAKTYAISVGVANYSSDKLKTNAANDVKLINSVLVERGLPHDQIINITESKLAREKILQSIISVLGKLKCGDNFIFAISGIGFTRETGYFLAMNCLIFDRCDVNSTYDIKKARHRYEIYKKSRNKKRLRNIAEEPDILEIVEDPNLLILLEATGGEEEGAFIERAIVFTGEDIQNLSTIVRNRGANFVAIVNADHAYSAKIYDRQHIENEKWSLRYNLDKKTHRDKSARILLPGHGELTVLYASGEDESAVALKFAENKYIIAGDKSNIASYEEKYHANEEENVYYGLFIYAVASGIAEIEKVTARNIAAYVSNYYANHNRQKPRPVFESTDPDLEIIAELDTSKIGGNSIIIEQPTPKRGAIPIERNEVTVIGRVNTREELLTVALNSQLVDGVADRRFRKTIRLKAGINKVNIVAFSVSGRVFRRTLEFTYKGDKQSLVGEGRRYAVVIANQDYPAISGFSTLSTPLRDAHAISGILESKYGFETVLELSNGSKVSLLLENPTKIEIQRTLHKLSSVAGEKDTVLIFYAGHGVYDERTNKAYWVPSDAEAGFEPSFLSASDVSDAISRIEAGNILLVSDSCFSGALFRGGDQRKSEKLIEDRTTVMLRLQSQRSRRLMTSGNNEPVEDLGGNGHSIFARAFITGLEEMQFDAFSTSELFDRYIRIPVGANSDQEPQYRELRKVGHEGGDFVFVQSN